VPATLNVASVLALLALLKETAPGPLSLLQDTLSVLPCGKPSSLADPFKFTVLVGSVIV